MFGLLKSPLVTQKARMTPRSWIKEFALSRPSRLKADWFCQKLMTKGYNSYETFTSVNLGYHLTCQKDCDGFQSKILRIEQWRIERAMFSNEIQEVSQVVHIMYYRKCTAGWKERDNFRHSHAEKWWSEVRADYSSFPTVPSELEMCLSMSRYVIPFLNSTCITDQAVHHFKHDRAIPHKTAEK